MKRLPMRKIRDVLRLQAGGHSTRRIAVSLGVARTSVGEYLRRARQAELSWPLPEGMGDAELEERLFPPARDASTAWVQPDWAKVHRELRRPHVTLSLLWEEYREEHPDDGYGYSRFCELYRRSGPVRISIRANVASQRDVHNDVVSDVP